MRPALRIADRRLHNQYITRAARGGPADLVAWLGAVQAQEYPFAKWGLGLRMRETATDAQIERACDEGVILRTHVMRPTWHFVAAPDIRWMLELTGPRVMRAMGSYLRALELDAATLTRSTATIEAAVGGGRYLTRAELGAALAQAGIHASGSRLAMVAMVAELDGVICSGPRRGKQSTYALIAERAPAAGPKPRDEALAELTRRYFRSHGPATISDFVWWSGLLTGDAKRGLDIIRARSTVVGLQTYWSAGSGVATPAPKPDAHLLPIYDEFLVAYRRRDPVPHGPAAIHSPSHGIVTFQHALVIDGLVAGTWKARRTAAGPIVEVFPLRRLGAEARLMVAACVDRYGRFVGEPASLSFADPPKPLPKPARSL